MADPLPAGGDAVGAPERPLPDPAADAVAARDAEREPVAPAGAVAAARAVAGVPLATPAEAGAADVAEADGALVLVPAAAFPSGTVAAAAGPEPGVFAGGVSGAEAIRVAGSAPPIRETATPPASRTSSAHEAASQTTAPLRCESANECSRKPQPQPARGS
ncbi:MAG TPA: hypothetical protein VFE55_17735 [Acidimicrobiia bacterium]|nr:hypothetical protein [Acidimicrobiia bacterium]